MAQIYLPNPSWRVQDESTLILVPRQNSIRAQRSKSLRLEFVIPVVSRQSSIWGKSNLVRRRSALLHPVLLTGAVAGTYYRRTLTATGLIGRMQLIMSRSFEGGSSMIRPWPHCSLQVNSISLSIASATLRQLDRSDDASHRLSALI